MKRNKDNQYGYSAWSMEEVLRFARFFLIPLVVVILIAVILVMDKKKDSGFLQADGIEESTAPPIEESSSLAQIESLPAPSEPLFTANSVPQVTELINQYFTAKQNSDAGTIYRLFGWTEEIGQDGLQRQLQYDARYTEGYRNIVCYTAPGEIDGTYLVCVSYDLKFKNSLTLAPGFQWSYVRTGADGSLYLTVEDELSEPEKAFVQEALKADEIVLLRVEIYAKLRSALESDPALAESYGILEKKGGSTGAKQGEQHEANVQIDGISAPDGAPGETQISIEGGEENAEGAGEGAGESVEGGEASVSIEGTQASPESGEAPASMEGAEGNAESGDVPVSIEDTGGGDVPVSIEGAEGN